MSIKYCAKSVDTFVTILSSLSASIFNHVFSASSSLYLLSSITKCLLYFSIHSGVQRSSSTGWLIIF